MFEDRSKSNYSFSKMDQHARTLVALDEKEKKQNKIESSAHKKLFGELEKPTTQEVKLSVKQDIIKHNDIVEPLEKMPSSSYLKTFENKFVGDLTEESKTKEEQQNQFVEESNNETLNEIDFNKLIETTNNVKIDNSSINKEIKSITPKPKKNYSFRIKLVAGVYCILVALFGGWVISNTINITNTNSGIYDVTSKTSEVNANIFDIISDIKQLDNASGDPENETIVVKIATEEIQITPETIIEPNKYEVSSNWFDVFCNWIAGLFGG